MFVANKNKAWYWKAKHLNGVHFFKAEFYNFSYAKHSHEQFAIGFIEKGAQRFNYNGVEYISPARSIVVVNPEAVHNGASATDEGYQYRMTYIDPQLIEAIRTEYHGQKPRLSYFNNPVIMNKDLAPRLHYALLLQESEHQDVLESQTFFIQSIADLFISYSKPYTDKNSKLRDHKIIKTACDFIFSMAHKSISIEDISKSFYSSF